MKVCPVALKRTKLLLKAQAPVIQLLLEGTADFAGRKQRMGPEAQDIGPSLLVHLVECGVPKLAMAAMDHCWVFILITVAYLREDFIITVS